MRGRRPYHGWVITGTLAVTETIAWGVLYYAFAVFQVPMARELGWSPAVIAGAFSAALLVSGLAAPWVGRWVDRQGGRWLMAGGGLLGALLLVAWAGVRTVPVYYLIWVGMGLAMAATLYEPAFAVVTPWFSRQRARALLVITLAAGFASTIFLPLTTSLINRLGWRSALLALAAIVAVGTVPAHLLVLRRPPAVIPDAMPDDVRFPVSNSNNATHAAGSTLPDAPGPDDRQPATVPRSSVAMRGVVGREAPAVAGDAFRPGQARPAPEALAPLATVPSPAEGGARRGMTAAAARREAGFWLLGAALFLAMLATVASGLMLIPYLISRGFSPGLAATLTGLTGAFQVGARIAVTLFGDRWPQAWLLAVLLALQAAALVLLMVSVAPVAVLVAVALLGVGRGAITLMRAAIIVERYGPAHFGAINGVIALLVSAAAASAPLGAGLVLTLTGSYLPIFAGLALACLGAALAAARLHARPAPVWV